MVLIMFCFAANGCLPGVSQIDRAKSRRASGISSWLPMTKRILVVFPPWDGAETALRHSNVLLIPVIDMGLHWPFCGLNFNENLSRNLPLAPLVPRFEQVFFGFEP